MSKRSDALAQRLERGARALGEFAASLTESEWQTRIPHDGRKIGVVVHHVASVYPLEIELAQTVAAGKTVVGLTGTSIDEMNADHAGKNENVRKQETLELLHKNSTAAATALRALSDEDLDQAVPVSLYGDAVVTCQFVLEDHAVRHSYHHLARIRAALKR